jgi:KRAB domain-containing zinc finger protein
MFNGKIKSFTLLEFRTLKTSFLQCGGRFIERERLDRHIRQKHKKDEVRPFSCDQCPVSFKILNHLRSHQKITHSQAEKQFSCDHCEKAFVFKYLLTAHVQFAHSDVRRFSCNFCGVKFKGSSQMKIHCKTVHGEEKVYPCTKCTMKYRMLNELKSHLQDEHGISMNLQKYHL